MSSKTKTIIAGIIILTLIVIGIFIFKKADYYDVEFDSVEGTLVESQSVKEGEKAVKPEDPERKGYIFIGWFNGEALFDFSLPVEEDLVLVAKWQKKEKDIVSYIIKFDSRGGNTIANQIVKKNGKINKPTDPKRDGYVFKGWKKGNKLYDFNTIVTSNMTLVADWEKEKDKEKKESKPNNKTVNNGSNNSNPTTPSVQNKVTLATPHITRAGLGVTADGEVGTGFLLNSVSGITGVELYISTSQNGEYKLSKTILVKNLEKEGSVTAYPGQHVYYKVRTYLINSQGKFYSNFSNVLDIDNSLATPRITKQTLGGTADGTVGVGLVLPSEAITFITGVEVYESSSQNGTYTLVKTIPVGSLYNGNVADILVYKGQHVYYKVRTYAINSQGKFYSNFSNVLDADNSLATPRITKQILGASADGTTGVGLVLSSEAIDFITGVEVYESSSQNGTYTLAKTIPVGSLFNGNVADIFVSEGQHVYYKVRTYVTNSQGKFYSNYSNIIEHDN